MYGAPPGMTRTAFTLEISTTSPRSSRRICGSSAWHSQNGPYASVRTTRSSSSGSVSTTVLPRLAMPALQTSTSTRPKSASTASASPAHPSRSATEAWYARRPRPRRLGGRLVAPVVHRHRDRRRPAAG
jgi:hypothetical protein